jgi:hypothetical protein
MLAVADATTGPDATARMGTAEIMRRLNTPAKSTALDAVATALASGELVIEQPSAGSRAALYRIPGAVDYTRNSGRESRPQPAQSQRSEVPTTNEQRSEVPTTNPAATGRESRPQPAEPETGLWSEIPTACGRESLPHHSPIERVSEGVSEGPRSSVAPEFAEQLVGKITAAHVYVAWDLTPGEWLRIDALLKRSGTDMLAAVAVKAASKRDVSHARYFLRAWQSLPALPAPGTVPAQPAGPGADVIPFAVPGARRPGRVATAQAMFAAAAGLDPQEHIR